VLELLQVPLVCERAFVDYGTHALPGAACCELRRMYTFSRFDSIRPYRARQLLRSTFGARCQVTIMYGVQM
jgi:hypothetical protein